MLGQRIGQRRDATRALSRVQTYGAVIAAPFPKPEPQRNSELNNNVCPKGAKSQGFGDGVSIEGNDFLSLENLLTKGGESSSALISTRAEASANIPL